MRPVSQVAHAARAHDARQSVPASETSAPVQIFDATPVGLVKQAEHDDCYSACVASLLGFQLTEVPRFYREVGGSADLTQVPEVFGIIREWSDDEVMSCLREVGAPILPWYTHKTHAPECATCRAGWSEGRGAYLREHHPDLAARYAGYLKIHAAETAPVVEQFFAEWRALGLGAVDGVAPLRARV